jgi:two-component system, cell cycle response regulator
VNDDMQDARLAALSPDMWRKPDGVLLEAAAEGEWQVAQIRIIVVGLLLITPIYRSWANPRVLEYETGLAVTILAAIASVIIYVMLRRGKYHTSLAFFSSGLDVTLVSIALASFVAVGPPYAAANSRSTFPVYFLAIAASSLRYDRRVCTMTGLLAILQYSAIVVYEVVRWGINDPHLAPFQYGTFAWADQVTRVIMLFGAFMLSWEVVRRAQHLRQLSIMDRLTGLPNRAYFDTRAEAELSRARRHGHSFSLAILDVDHFKDFNDTFGHATGDRVLHTIASVLRLNAYERSCGALRRRRVRGAAAGNEPRACVVQDRWPASGRCRNTLPRRG